MKRHRIGIALSALMLTALTTLSATVTSASAATTPYCGITWGSQEKVLLLSTPAQLTNLRTGRHDCYDRLVLDINGTPAPGYHVRYVDAYQPFGWGPTVPVAGGAILAVMTYAPASVPWAPLTHVVTPNQFSASGYLTFRDLVYGGTVERNTEFALGVRARLPFRVFSLSGPGTGTRLVIDVAHRWS
ncbi:MAG: hypothetical protein ABR540_14245 [Acidimicrobiales bacterium]